MPTGRRPAPRANALAVMIDECISDGMCLNRQRQNP